MKKTAMHDKNNLSPLEQAQLLKFGGSRPNKHKRTLDLVLPLTSLIDAFTIIVIYLLIGTQSGGLDSNPPAGLQLPVAEAGIAVDKEAPIVRIEKGRYFVNDKNILSSQLASTLAELKKAIPEGTEAEILIQADQQMDYAQLDPLLRAGSMAGIQKLKFAVLPQK